MNFSPVFNRSKANNKKGLYTVNIRASKDGKVIYLSIPGFPKIEKKQWNDQKSIVSDKHPFEAQLNHILKQEVQKLNGYYLDELSKGRIVTLKDVVEFYNNPEQRKTLNDFLRRNIRKYCKENNLEHRTYQTYVTMRTHLDEFNPEIKFYEVNRRLAEDFNRWMETKKSLNGSSRKKYLTRLQRMIKEAAKAKLVDYDELMFDRIRVKVEDPKRVSLTKEEIIKIRDLDLNEAPELIEARDQFLFLCYSGLYYLDLRGLTSENLVNTEYGLVIEGNRGKNENKYVSPVYLFPRAVEILGRWRNKTKDEYLFDCTSDQEFNRKLKKIGTKVKLSKKLSNKVARHSFADLMIGAGFERQFVARMMGHKKESTTQIYYEMNTNHLVKSKFGQMVFDL